MSLRVRLFLLLGGIVVLLVAAEWWLVRSLTRNLSGEMGRVAVSVGHSVATVFSTAEILDTEQLHLEQGVHWVSPDALEKVPEASAAADTGSKRVYVFRRKAETTNEEDGTGLHHYEVHLDSSEEDREAVAHVRVVGPHLEESIPVPKAGLERTLNDFWRRLFVGTLGVLGVGLVLAGLVAHRVTAPLRELRRAARHVGEGDLGVQVPVRAGGEVGEAIQSFNHMSQHLKRLDEDARALRERQHLSELGEVARGMAHSLRNPLNALGLSVEELASRVPPEASPETLLDSVRRQIRRIDHSIRSFLVLTSEGTSVEVDHVDIYSLVQDVVLEALQDSRGRIRIDVEDPGHRPAVKGVGPELRAVLHALVTNAVEASPDGARVRVRVHTPAEGRVGIEIEDEGPGLAEDVKARLFTPHLTTKANGTGMGLFLAHRIVTSRYGGTLELTEREGGGTRAVLELSQRRMESDG